MYDGVDFFLGENVAHLVYVAKVVFIKRHVFSAEFANAFHRFEFAVAKIVCDYGVVSVFDKVDYGMRTYVTCSACNQNAHIFSFSASRKQ